MRALTWDIPFTSNAEAVYRLTPIGDVHLGARACREREFARTIERIAADENHFWVGMGDYCMTEDTEILTRRGFVTREKLEIGNEVAAFDGEHLVWTPLRGIYAPGIQETVRLSSKSFETVCTPGHGWFVVDSHLGRDSTIHKVETRGLKTHHRLIVAASMIRDVDTSDITEEEAALIGWLVTDGCISKKQNGINFSISQAKEPYRSEIRSRFADWITGEYDQISGGSTFNLKTAKMRCFLQRINVDPLKLKSELPHLVTRLTEKARIAMMDAMLKAEGWQERGLWRFSQLPGPVMDAFVILATLNGIRLSRGKNNVNGVRTVGLMKSRPTVTVADLKVRPSDSQSVWCPMTDYGSWVCRQGTQVTITGNCDAIGRNSGDKRSDESALASWLWGEKRIFERERVRLLEYLMPIAGKCLGLLTGNHEEKVLNVYGQDMYYSVAEALTKEAGHGRNLALGYAGFVRMRFRRQWEGQAERKNKGGLSSVPITIYATHGYGGGRKAGGKVNKLSDMAAVADADIYLFGHVHAPEASIKEQRMSLNQKGKAERRTYAALLTGTYLGGYEDDVITYSEKFGFSEAVIGSPTITLSPMSQEPDKVIQVTI